MANDPEGPNILYTRPETPNLRMQPRNQKLSSLSISLSLSLSRPLRTRRLGEPWVLSDMGFLGDSANL